MKSLIPQSSLPYSSVSLASKKGFFKYLFSSCCGEFFLFSLSFSLFVLLLSKSSWKGAGFFIYSGESHFSFCIAMTQRFTSLIKLTTHQFHKGKVRFLRNLDRLDAIPVVVRIPLGWLLLMLGVIGLRIPFINGMILMILGARMLGKDTFQKVYVRLINFFAKRYKNLKSALFHNLKD